MTLVILLLLAIRLVVVLIRKLLHYDRLKHKANQRSGGYLIETETEIEDVRYKEVKDSEELNPTDLIVEFICILMIVTLLILHVFGYPPSESVGLF